MADLVLCADVHSYERVAMAARLAAGNCISPVTGQPLPQRQQQKSHALRNMIQAVAASAR